jgi:hypothetical protein
MIDRKLLPVIVWHNLIVTVNFALFDLRLMYIKCHTYVCNEHISVNDKDILLQTSWRIMSLLNPGNLLAEFLSHSFQYGLLTHGRDPQV